MKPEDLLRDVRNYLDITWVDEPGDRKLLGIIERGMDYLERWAQGKLDFSEEKQPRALLLDYCRYVRSGALDEFRVNYLHDLMALQLEGGAAKEQTFNDGTLTVYAVENAGLPGNMKKGRLVKKAGPLRYEERTVGVSRFYTALQNRERIDLVLRVPHQDGIGALDVCIPRDGKQYQIVQCQHPQGAAPCVDDLALERVGVDYELAEAT